MSRHVCCVHAWLPRSGLGHGGHYMLWGRGTGNRWSTRSVSRWIHSTGTSVPWPLTTAGAYTMRASMAGALGELTRQ